MRLFAGIPITGAVGESVVRLIQDHRAAVPGCRWVREDGLHLTLRFLGEVSEADFPAVATWFQEAVAGVEAGRLELAAGGAFERGDRIVLWVGVQPSTWLEDLAARFSKPVAGVAPDPLPFKAHITVGRCRVQRSERTVVREFIGRFRKVSLEGVVIESPRVVLYESHLGGGGGPRYEERLVYPNTAG